MDDPNWAETLVGVVIRKALEEISITDPRAECLIDILRQGLSRAEFRMIRKKWQLRSPRPYTPAKTPTLEDDDIPF